VIVIKKKFKWKSINVVIHLNKLVNINSINNKEGRKEGLKGNPSPKFNTTTTKITKKEGRAGGQSLAKIQYDYNQNIKEDKAYKLKDRKR